MSAGQRTQNITDIHIDMKRLSVTFNVDTIIEDDDGVLTNIGSKTYEKQYDDQASLTQATVADLVSAVVSKANKSNPKPISISLAPAPMIVPEDEEKV